MSVRVELDEFAGLSRPDGAPGVPGDLEDDERDGEADDRVGTRETECDQGGADHYSKRHEAVDAGVVAVSDQKLRVDAVLAKITA